MNVRPPVVPEADPWAASLGATTVTLYAHHVADGPPLPAGPVQTADATDPAALPRVSVQLPGVDAQRLVLLLDGVLAHPAYRVWAETGTPLAERFYAVPGGRTKAPVVLVTGPMRVTVTDHAADAGDPGDPPYRETAAEVGYEDLAALREALAVTGASS